MSRSVCNQCGKTRPIVSSREVCRDCAARDGRLDRLQHELFEAVMAHEFSSVTPRTWPRVSTAAHALMEYYR